MYIISGINTCPFPLYSKAREVHRNIRLLSLLDSSVQVNISVFPVPAHIADLMKFKHVANKKAVTFLFYNCLTFTSTGLEPAIL